MFESGARKVKPPETGPLLPAPQRLARQKKAKLRTTASLRRNPPKDCCTIPGMRRVCIVGGVLLSFLGASLSPAQQLDGRIHGQVVDPSGAAIHGARVAVQRIETGSIRRVASGREGLYAAPALPPGRYTVSVEADGFRTTTSEPFGLALGERLQADFVLELGAESDAITVSAAASLIDAASAAVGSAIPNRFIVSLPLNGRNFLQLSLLTPGAVPAAVGSPGSERGRFAFQANGARESANSFLYDGVYAIDPILNSFSFAPAVDAVREFRIQTSNSEAGLGRNSGGQVAVAIKQGTNDVHGTLYEFLRNDRFDARNFFSRPDDPTPTLRRHQFGFSLGGPLVRNATFLFANFEGLRETRASTRTTNVPTGDEREGDFSASAGQAPIDFFTRQPFPNSRLPFAHPVGRGVAHLYPPPNRSAAGQNFVAAPLGTDHTGKFDIRLDQRVGERGQLSGRFSFADSDRSEPYAAQGFSSVPGYGNDLEERGQNAMVSETHTLGSHWINEARFGYNHISNRTLHANSGTSLNSQVGLPDFATRPLDLGLSFVQVTGLSSLGGEFNNPQVSTVESWQISDTLSYSRGRHLMQFGFEQRRIGQDGFRNVLARGSLYFTDRAFTQNALADLLLGLPSYTLAARSDNLQAVRTGATNIFVADTWRVSPTLTLSLGLRYEYNVPAYDAEDAASIYDPDSLGIVRLGQGGLPRSGFHADGNNFAPRLSLALRPGGTDRLVLRGGWGLYYNFSDLAAGQGIYFNPPFFQSFFFLPSRQAPLTIDRPWPEGGQAPIPPSVTTYDRNLRTSYAQQWNFTVQTELLPRTVLSVGYNGSRGTKLIGARDINQPAPSPMQPNWRPLPMFSDINLIAASFDSIYHSLQTQFQCRFQTGLTGLFSYTWSKSIDNASNFFASAGDANYPQDSNNTAAERARSSFDTPHRFSGSFVYELPFGPGKRWGGQWTGGAARLLGDWQFNGIVTLQSGQPYTVALPGEFDNSNTGRSSYGFGAGDRPNLVGDPKLADPDPQLWLNPAAFALPAYGTFGNAGRNIVGGPGLANVDFSLLKDAALSESVTLQFRAEFFNLLNTSNFLNPNVFFGTPGFGRLLAARDGREVQFGVKLIF